MIRQKQLFRHNPPETIGDCMRAVLACLLDMRVEEVPHFCEIYGFDTKDEMGRYVAVVEMDEWLEQQGYYRVIIGLPVDSVDDALNWTRASPNAYFTLGGTSRNNLPHVVIARNGKIEWDTAIDNSGIIGPIDGLYEVGWLVPINLTTKGKINV